jgi:hypothetical protein
MRLDLPKDNAEASAVYDDLAATGVYDAKGAQRVGELRLVARVRSGGQRPGHVGERDAKRGRRPFDGQAGRDRLL